MTILNAIVISVALVTVSSTVSYGSPGDDEKTNAPSSVLGQAQSHEPGKISEPTPCLPANDIHYSKIPPDLLAVMATYLSPKDMAELAHVGQVPKQIVAMAVSQLETFKIKPKQLVRESLQFLLNNPKNPKDQNLRLKHLDIAQNISEQDRAWITERFPNAKIITPVTVLKKGDELYDALPAEITALGGDMGKLYRITDPTGQVPPFVLTDLARDADGNALRMDHKQALGWDDETGHHPGYCEARGGTLATGVQLEALKRAMQHEGKYNAQLIAGKRDPWFWTSSAHPKFLNRVLSYCGGSGEFYGLPPDNSNSSVRCVLLPAVVLAF